MDGVNLLPSLSIKGKGKYLLVGRPNSLKPPAVLYNIARKKKSTQNAE
jgi:hypothetical protein